MKGQTPAYSGHAFHAAFGEGEVSGRVVIEPERLLFLSETANVELSLDRLNIERQAAGRLLCFAVGISPLRSRRTSLRIKSYASRLNLTGKPASHSVVWLQN